jgi:hypothetical protein
MWNNFLEKYINVFFWRFKSSFKNKHLEAEVWHSKDILGIFFKVVPDNNKSINKKLITWNRKNDIDFFDAIMCEKNNRIENAYGVSIYGFFDTGFYVIKPNKKELWHKLSAYTDVQKYMHAILIAGRESFSK